MKKLAAELLFAKNARFSGLIAFMIVGAIALGCTCGKELGNLGKDDDSTTASNTSSTTEPSDAPVKKADASTGQVPSNDQLQDLAKTTTLDFNNALQTEDFSDFHQSISKPFQKEASPERFKQVFKAFIDAGIDFKEVRSLTANFTTPAAIDKSVGGKRLKLKGNYATSPRRTNFDLQYIPEGDEWKLIHIEINTKDQATNYTSPPETSTSSNSAGVTMANFTKMQTGMTYDEVITILGKEGEVISENDIGGYKTIMYKWDGDEGGWGANMNAMFQNGKLTTKSQFGLK